MNTQTIVIRLALAAALGACATARADGQIFMCIDAAGHKELTDMNRTGACKLLELPGAITAPPRRPASPAATARSAPRAVAPALAPSDFPKVDGAEQKARDADRRRILQDELGSEEKKLAALRKEYNGGQPERQGNERDQAKYQERVAQLKDNLNRAEQNVAALKREMATIR